MGDRLKSLCRNCRRINKQNAKYCKYCGSILVNAKSDNDQRQPIPTPKPDQSNKILLSIIIALIVISVPVFFYFYFYFEKNISSKGMIAKHGSSIVMVHVFAEKEVENAQGSGIIVNENGLILTNSHILDNFNSGIIKLSSGGFFAIKEKVIEDPYFDLAIIKVDAKNLKPVPINFEDKIEIGEKVIVIGNPKGLENTVSEGIISGLRQTDVLNYIQTTAPISPGSSGGALFNKAGKLIGITTLTLTDGQNLNFAVPIAYAFSLLYFASIEGLHSDMPEINHNSFIENETRIIKSMEKTMEVSGAKVQGNISKLENLKMVKQSKREEILSEYLDFLKMSISYKNRKNILEKVIERQN